MSRGLFDLTGRVALATGANSGIGLGFLPGCAKQGACATLLKPRHARYLSRVAIRQIDNAFSLVNTFLDGKQS